MTLKMKDKKVIMTLKIKDDKKNYLDETVFQTILKRENLNNMGLFVDKGSGSGPGIFWDPDPGDPKRPDPDPQHW